MEEISAEVMQQLEQAQAELAEGMEAEGPLVATELLAPAAAEIMFGAAGSGRAKYALLDHYFTSSFRRFWLHAGGAWRHRNVTNTEEQGIAQVAFASDRLDGRWDSDNRLTTLRCWKYL